MVEVTKNGMGNYHLKGTGRSTMFRRKNPSLTSEGSESVELSATVHSTGVTLWIRDENGRQIGVSLPKDFVNALSENNTKVNEWLGHF